MNGLEATKIIRNELKLTIPIIILTADIAERTKADAIAAGASEFLLKPAYTKEIVKKLQKFGLVAQVTATVA